jgi:hypothetical protein
MGKEPEPDSTEKKQLTKTTSYQADDIKIMKGRSEEHTSELQSRCVPA